MKKNLVSKILAMVLSVSLLTGLTACGSSDSDGSDTGNASGTESSADSGNDSTGTSSEDAEDSSELAESSEEEEVSYDFGGATVRVFAISGSGYLSKLRDDYDGDDAEVYQDYIAQVNEKYNVNVECVTLEGYDGYNMADVLIQGATSGDAGVDVCLLETGAFISLAAGGYLIDLGDDIDELGISSTYTDAASWGGANYGFTMDDIGYTRALTYSRDYLEEIGMDVTPTDKFMNGEWSYDDVLEYFAELKAKLPDGVYCIAVYPSHWAYMAGAANGVVAVDGDGNVNYRDEAYIEALEFYVTLLNAGYAAPMECEVDEDGDIVSLDAYYGSSNQAGSGSDSEVQYVITMAENWSMSSLESKVGTWGITYLPWGSNVTVDGDYTTLSDNYGTAMDGWTMYAVMDGAEEATGIPAVMLLQIILDYFDLCTSRVSEMREAYVIEQSGGTYDFSFDDSLFCTDQDAELYGWGISRVVFEWGQVLNTYTKTNNTAYRIIAAQQDGRTVAESNYQIAISNMQEAGLID